MRRPRQGALDSHQIGLGKTATDIDIAGGQRRAMNGGSQTSNEDEFHIVAGEALDQFAESLHGSPASAPRAVSQKLMVPSLARMRSQGDNLRFSRSKERSIPVTGAVGGRRE
jgi:hypothetical protein